MGGNAPAFCDVLGRPVLHRIIADLRRQGVGAMRVISEKAAPPLPARGPGDFSQVNFTVAPQPWRAAEIEFTDLMQANPDAVLVLRVGPYVEIDVDALLQHHFDNRFHVTGSEAANGEPLDVFVVSASRRNDAAYMFRHQLRAFRSPRGTYVFHGYWNPLISPRDLRVLAIDGLLQRNRMTPEGHEIRPGVWVGEGGQIDRGARVLAPVYLGAHCRVRRNAVITRCSVLEHHACIAPGTVVENSTVLPYTTVGAGLDILNSVIGNRRLVHLLRNVEVQINDPKLMDIASHSAPWRVLGYAAALAGFLPAQFFRGVFARSGRERAAQLPAAVNSPSPALKTPAAFQAPATAEAARFPSKWS
jgi:carbonic anhydrase/acetyltransferase-like protein (isoleucine patch superfamily)